MPQQVLIDRRWAATYLAVLIAACSGRQGGAVVPAELPTVPMDSARAWAGASTPAQSRELKFRWQLQDDRGAAGGRGSARIAPPDSVRLDVVGPLGAGRGAAVVVGDDARWTDPPDIIERLVPSYPLMWAMFGVMRTPPTGSEVRGVDNGSTLTWVWTRQADTVSYVRDRDASSLRAEARSAGRVVGRVETAFGPDGQPVASRLDVPSAPARLNITFTESTAAASFSPDLWDSPRN